MRKHLVWALGLALALGVSAVAYGSGNTLNTQDMAVTVTPSKQSKTKFGAAKLRSVTTTGSTGTGAFAITPVTSATIFYDKGIKFDTKGLKQCKANLDGTTTQVALQKCGNAKVGVGQAKVKIGGNPALPDTVAKITAFNAKPKGDKPVILLHTRVDAIASTTVLVGTLSKVSGKYGWKLNVVVPPLPAGTATTVFDVTVQHKAVKVGKVKHTYVTARCPAGKWNYKGSFVYKSDPLDPTPRAGSLTVTDQQGCQKKA
ncbi:MAG: hypothetical protein U0R52_14095 [Solirubrobacterales bacterium]